MHTKRYEAELDLETGKYWGVVVQYGEKNAVKGKRRVSKGHDTADEAARAAYALFPQSHKDPEKGVVTLTFEEANGIAVKGGKK